MKAYINIILSILFSFVAEFSYADSGKIIFPSNLDEPTHVVMSLLETNKNSVIDMYRIISKINKNRREDQQIQFVLVYPESFGRIYVPEQREDVKLQVASIEAQLGKKSELVES